LGGDAEAGEQSVACGGGEGEEDGEAFGKAQAAEEPEQARSEERDVQACDDEEMEGAGALEAFAEGVGEVGAVAEEGGVEERGVVGGELE
jgi:hypothetical protein